MASTKAATGRRCAAPEALGATPPAKADANAKGALLRKVPIAVRHHKIDAARPHDAAARKLHATEARSARALSAKLWTLTNAPICWSPFPGATGGQTQDYRPNAMRRNAHAGNARASGSRGHETETPVRRFNCMRSEAIAKTSSVIPSLLSVVHQEKRRIKFASCVPQPMRQRVS